MEYDPVQELYTWTKGENSPLSENFTTGEFTCHCSFSSCVTQIIAKELISDLQLLRNDVDLPIMISSGYRCPEYQASLAAQGYETAKGISQHEVGEASDLQCKDLLKLVSTAERYFKAIGIANTFIHVDERKDKIRRWRYNLR